MTDYFSIISQHSGLALDIEGGSTAQGARLIVWDQHGGSNQRFRFDPNGFIVSAHSNLVLDVEGGAAQGRKIIQWTPHGGPNQRWRYSPDGTIRLEGFNLVMDIEGASRNKGASVIAWPFHGQSNQLWRIQYATPPMPTGFVQPPAQYARPAYNYQQSYVRTAGFVVPFGVDPITAQKMMKASQVFRIYDKDCSGSLSYKEWKKAMKALGYQLQKSQKEQLFYMIDKDRSGQIDEREFCEFWAQYGF